MRLTIPPLLRRLLAEVANGGFGPGSGLIGVQGGSAADQGRTIEDLYEHAASRREGFAYRRAKPADGAPNADRCDRRPRRLVDHQPPGPHKRGARRVGCTLGAVNLAPYDEHFPVTTDEFIALAEKVSGKELHALFNEWLFAAGPQVAASDVSHLGARAARTLLFRLQDGHPTRRK